MTELRMATWWTPTGWVQAPEPQAYHDASFGPDVAGRDWLGDLQAQSYRYAEARTEVDGISVDLMLVHIEHGGDATTAKHMLVEMEDISGTLAHIFIEAQHTQAYWFTLYPILLAAQRTAEAALQQAKMTKAHIAYVRHGHGESTINESGDENRDERKRSIDDAARRRQAAKKQNT